jgi:hypothetical protein
MRTFIEASLVLAVAVVLTLAIMAVIFPRHVLGGGQQALESRGLRPAVFVYGTHDRPGAGGGAPPARFDNRMKNTRCPYLAALSAASKCPAAPRRAAEMGCPYLEQLQRQLSEANFAPTAPLRQSS